MGHVSVRFSLISLSLCMPRAKLSYIFVINTSTNNNRVITLKRMCDFGASLEGYLKCQLSPQHDHSPCIDTMKHRVSSEHNSETEINIYWGLKFDELLSCQIFHRKFSDSVIQSGGRNACFWICLRFISLGLPQIKGLHSKTSYSGRSESFHSRINCNCATRNVSKCGAELWGEAPDVCTARRTPSFRCNFP